MQKQVEVRMDESHLEPPRVDTADSVCSSLCDKIMRNMVLTLTILGEFFLFGEGRVLLPAAVPPIIILHLLCCAAGGP